jgi:hypothetical protein
VARTAVITLDETQYTVHALNISELQEVGAILKEGGENFVVGMKVLQVAMRRAEPKTDPGLIEPKIGELSEATVAILKLSGIETDASNPQTAAPAES